MDLGIVKEIKTAEGRVAMTPSGIRKLLEKGPNSHKVFVETQAGIASGFNDEDYVAAGATILPTAKEVWDSATLMVHVKEPLPSEFGYIRSDHILFTYLHLAAAPELTKELMKSGCVGIAYETLELSDKSLPLLKPMSAVAGKMAFVYALYNMQAKTGGMGMYMGEIFGKSQVHCVIIGGGIVGTNSADAMVGIGVNLTIIERDANRRAQLQQKYPTAKILPDSELRSVLYEADVVIGAVLVTGAKAPKIITHEDLGKMKKNAVIVDISIDQGGITEDSHSTSILEPSYKVGDVTLCCIPNIPGTVPRTSTLLLTEATQQYVEQLANQGLAVLKTSPEFQTALNIFKGKCTDEAVCKAVGIDYTPITSLNLA